METGTIQRLVRDKGFGFIKTAEGNKEYFFHRSALKNVQFEELSEGREVHFEKASGPKGLRAEDVYA